MKERQVVVVTDHSADLPSSKVLKDKYQVEEIPQIPLAVTFGKTSYVTQILDQDVFSTLVHESGFIPKTGALGQTVFTDFYSRHADQDKDILSINIGDNLSAVGNQARLAAKEMELGKVEVFDSGTVSMALGFLAIAAKEAAMAGANRDEIVEMLNGMKDRVVLRVITPNMPYLRESGRVSHLTSMLGSVLRINPILQIDSSKVDNVAKARTAKGALDWMVNFTRETGDAEKVAIVDFEARKEAENLKLRLMEEVNIPESSILMGQLGPITASHGGPGTLGMAVVFKK